MVKTFDGTSGSRSANISKQVRYTARLTLMDTKTLFSFQSAGVKCWID